MTYRDAVEFMEQFEYLLKETIVSNKELVITKEYCIKLLQALNTTA